MLRRSPVTALVLGLVVTNASAQDSVVRGVVIGPDGAPLAIDDVVLHRVGPAGGAAIARGPSGVDGRFSLTAPATRDTSVVYFVAVQYAGQLYIGEPFRPATQGTPEQVLQVGPPAPAASPRLGDSLVLVVPLLIAAAAVLYLLLPRRRVAPERAALIRIAEIDERLPEAPQGQSDALRAERTRLLERLRAG